MTQVQTDDRVHLIHHPVDLAVVRLEPQAVVPDWALAEAPLVSVSATASETSIVCLAEGVPPGTRQEGPFQVFEIAGPLDFSLVGVLAVVLQPVVHAGISVFTVSTFDTDWILVPTGHKDDARRVWSSAGHTIEEGSPWA